MILISRLPIQEMSVRVMKGKGTLMTDLDGKKLKIKVKHKYEMDLFAITDIIGTAVNI